jgi:acyl carrier protein
MNDIAALSFDEIADAIVDFVIESQPSDFDRTTLPRDESLLKLYVLDSFGILGVISFVEEEWALQIGDEEITVENFSSIDNIAALVTRKLASRPGEAAS